MWAVLYSLTWLLPVGSSPWATFFSDLLAGYLVLCAGLFLFVRFHEYVNWSGIAISCLLLATVPLIQWRCGLLPYFGQAWISALYTAGLGLCVLIGGAWERCSPGVLLTSLFSAILIAAIVSVGLQLYVWLDIPQISSLESFFMPARIPRVAGALGQPNQLATLLLWAMLSTLYFHIKKYITSGIAVLLLIYLLTGLTLTQSRTAVLNVLLVSALMGVRWTEFGKFVSFKSIMAVLLYTLICPFLLEGLASVLAINPEIIIDRLGEPREIRIQAWLMFLDSAISKFWFGYGWSDVSVAQVMNADSQVAFGGIFKQSHNLFLDLFIWVGLPLGFLISSMIMWIIYRLWMQSSDAISIILFLIIFVAGIHSMLEFPLHYAYFLAPAGLVLGVALSRHQKLEFLVTRRWCALSALLAFGLAMWITAFDYLRVEEDFQSFHLEQAFPGVGSLSQAKISDVIALDQLEELNALLRIVPQANMSEDELQRLELFGRYYPSSVMAHKLVLAYRINGYPHEAELWLKKLCGFSKHDACLSLKR
ncbi:PglL family O-oligosaccharyltransferase [Rhodoferax sp.]|uniref:PglL family O-oligosaccharyltransferase n=1 Tax=Rhodoferax sp. TaxID=50421 RepID=UPI002ACD882E|nr:Wzy polymerase domain-containing protein [Rhodoferax sp.]